MAHKIPDSFIKDVLSAVDIVDVIGRHVELKKNGPNHHGICPFHNEKTGSFTVSESKQFFHCFGCSAHGDAIKFLMDHLGMSFIDSIKELASEAGMALPESEHIPDGNKVNPVIFKLLKEASEYYVSCVGRHAEAIAYMLHRGISPRSAIKYQIGYAPSGWHNLSEIISVYDGPEMEACGLTAKSKKQRTYDRFRSRLMIPVMNANGVIIGFGGRSITGEDPKYLNSPDTVVFDKGAELFGLYQSMSSIKEKGFVVVVEGFIDVISLSEAGITNAVATMGTALTQVHAKRLFKLSDKVIFCFDGDSAGKRAAWRALELSLPHLTDSKKVRFVFLPDGEDPDSYVKKIGSVEFENLYLTAKSLSVYLLDTLKKEYLEDDAEGKARLLHEVKKYINLVSKSSAPIFRMQLLKSLSNETGLSVSEIESLFES